MPAPEVDVTVELVGSLVSDQFPDLAHLDVKAGESGWDNAVFRLGDDWCVRMPRRAAGAALVANEQRWLPGLAERLPLPIPAPVGQGRPGPDYPWSWSICRWMPGQIAALHPPDDLDDTAGVLGQFLAALHQPAPADAPANPLRGVALADRDEITRTAITSIRGAGVSESDADRLSASWDAALAMPEWSGPPVWLHGDLHPANLIVDDGHLSAVIDFGDLTGGDPATDLAIGWSLFHADAQRSRFRAAAGYADDAPTWARALGWAVAFTAVYLANSADNPTIAAIGRHTLNQVLSEG